MSDEWNDFVNQFNSPAAVPQDHGEPNDAENRLARKLECCADLALDRLAENLKTRIDPSDNRYVGLQRNQGVFVNTALEKQLRADGNRLKKRKLDLLPELLRRIKELKKERLCEPDPKRTEDLGKQIEGRLQPDEGE